MIFEVIHLSDKIWSIEEVIDPDYFEDRRTSGHLGIMASPNAQCEPLAHKTRKSDPHAKELPLVRGKRIYALRSVAKEWSLDGQGNVPITRYGF